MEMFIHNDGMTYYDSEKVDAEIDKKDAVISEALDRIGDMLEADDGQAYKEAERFYEKHRGRHEHR